MRSITYSEALENESRYIFVDVRTPSEYENSTIPGAINIPILSDFEHSQVGTAYKHEGRRVATKKALELFSPNLVSIYEKFEELLKYNKNIIVFCARGGMRSSTLVSFLETLAIPVLKLDFGYKSYRQYVMENLEVYANSKIFVTLYGNTGVGKTNILKALASKGFDVLDLEGYANHRGSMLGHVGLGKENSQRMFESLVFDKLRSSGKVIFTEGESKRIGKIIMPNYLYNAIHNSHQITLKTSLENRIKIIREEYINLANTQENIEAIKSLNKYISSDIIESYVSELKNENYDMVIESLIVDYYDKKYKTIKNDTSTVIDFSSEVEAVESLIKYVESIGD